MFHRLCITAGLLLLTGVGSAGAQTPLSAQAQPVAPPAIPKTTVMPPVPRHAINPEAMKLDIARARAAVQAYQHTHQAPFNPLYPGWKITLLGSK